MCATNRSKIKISSFKNQKSNFGAFEKATMKKFVQHILLFLAPVFVLVCCFELALRCIPNDASFREEQLNKRRNQMTTLILGDSHPYFGINPKFISESSFNLAAVSETPDVTALVLAHEINRLPKLKTVVVGVSYFSLFESLPLGSEAWRLRHYTIYRQMHLGTYPKHYFESSSFSTLQNISRLYAYYGKDNSEISCNVFGAGVTYTSFNSLRIQATARTAAKRHTFDLTAAATTSQIRKQQAALNEIVTLASKHKIKLLFTILPVTNSYRNQIPEQQRQLVEQTLTNLAKNNEHVRFRDFSDNPNFKMHDFYDADHLNIKGAQKCSKMLQQCIMDLE